MKGMLSTADLRRLGACENHLTMIENIIGTSPVKVSEDTCVRIAHAVDWEWAGFFLLPRRQRRDFYRVKDQEFNKYSAHIQREWDKYMDARNKLRLQSTRVVARAFVEAYYAEDGEEK